MPFILSGSFESPTWYIVFSASIYLAAVSLFSSVLCPVLFLKSILNAAEPGVCPGKIMVSNLISSSQISSPSPNKTDGYTALYGTSTYGLSFISSSSRRRGASILLITTGILYFSFKAPSASMWSVCPCVTRIYCGFSPFLLILSMIFSASSAGSIIRQLFVLILYTI